VQAWANLWRQGRSRPAGGLNRQTQPSGLAITPNELQATPFIVRVKLDDEPFASSLPAGSVGVAAIYTDHVKPTHFIRKVLLRQIAILNYINPF
jgi:hypothetical protein